jgi:hypothetical protein
VRRHYQWIVMHDLLRRVVGDAMATQAATRRRYYKYERVPFIRSSSRRLRTGSVTAWCAPTTGPIAA